jgi:hypothetical protein
MVEGKVSNGFNFKAWVFYILCQTTEFATKLAVKEQALGCSLYYINLIESLLQGNSTGNRFVSCV